MCKRFVAALFVLALGLSAPAAAAPIGSSTLHQMAQILDSMGYADLQYAPTYVPGTYALFTNNVAQGEYGATFASTKYKQASANFHNYQIAFSVQAVKNTTCSKAARTTIKVNGKTIYWNGADTAWQCIRAPSGALVGAAAVSPKLGQTELVRVVASVTRFK